VRRLVFRRLEKSFQFGKCQDILPSSRRFLSSYQAGEVQRQNLSPKSFDFDRVILYFAKTAQPGNLGKQIQLAEVSLKSEYCGVTQGRFIPNER